MHVTEIKRVNCLWMKKRVIKKGGYEVKAYPRMYLKTVKT